MIDISHIPHRLATSLFPEFPRQTCTEYSEKSVCRTKANRGQEIDLLGSQGHELMIIN